MSPPTVTGQFTSNKIPLTAADAGIEVTVPTWPGIAAGQRIYLTWDGNASKDRIPTTPLFYSVTPADVANPNFSWTITIPASYTLAEGSHILSYQGTSGTGLNPTWPVAGKTVIIDRTAPGGEVLPILLNEDGTQIIRQLTTANLVNDEFVTLVADYDGTEVNDVITPWIKGEADTDPTFFPGSDENVDDDEYHTAKVKLRFKRADIESIGDGLNSFGYRIRDEPNNVSILSPEAKIRVVLLDVPKQLLAPIVPDYLDGGGNNDGVVSYDEAVAGVDVQIPEYQTPQEGDIIVVNWGGQFSLPYTLGPLDIGNDPVTTIQMLFPSLIGAGSNVQLPVSYTVERSSITYTSAILQVNVDLAVPGGPDPQTNLKQIVIESSSGVIDSIPKVDFGKSATAIINNRTNDTTPTFAFVAGDLITITWGGVDVAPSYTIITGDNTQPLRLTVAGTYINTTGSIPVNYRIRRELLPAYTPPQYSTGAPVQKLIPVESDQGRPNDGQPFDGISFPDAPDDYIDREIAENPVRVRCVVDLANMAALDTVDLSAKATDLSDIERPGVTYDAPQHTISPEEYARGYYDFVIPRSFFLQICQGFMVVTYTLTNNLVCCSRNKFLFISSTLQTSSLPWRACHERSGHHA